MASPDLPPFRERTFEIANAIRALRRRTRGDARVKVAILDGPVDASVPQLQAAKLHGALRQPTGASSWAVQHATTVASIVFGSGGVFKGLSPGCTGLVVPIFDGSSGAAVCSEDRLADAIDRALDEGAHIINVSAGAYSDDGRATARLAAAAARCERAGSLIVAATGNQGYACAQVPAAIATVLAVGAADRHGAPLPSSNWGHWYTGHGLVAPGTASDILGLAGEMARIDGTSIAAAFVSGVTALLLSLQVRGGAPADPLFVRRVLLESSRAPLDGDARALGGCIDVEAAVARLLPPAPGDRSIAWRPTSSALRRTYGGVPPERFGWTRVEVSERDSAWIPDLLYRLPDGQLGMHIVPVSHGAPRPTSDRSARAENVIDPFLRSVSQLPDDAPIYAVVSYTRPDEHTIALSNLFNTYKRRLGHQHIGAYIGDGRTTHALPADRLDDWIRRGDDYEWNVRGRPGAVHLLSLRDCPQAVLNQNCRIVDAILSHGVRVPDHTEELTSKVFDLNTCLQYYRDWVRDAEYLYDLEWYTNCADHKAMVVNVAVNLPHNAEAFEEIFGDEGAALWDAVRARYEAVSGTRLSDRLNTRFTPLWKLEGIPAHDVRPLALHEYHQYHAFRRQNRLDRYAGPRPLAPGQAMAWAPETVIDSLAAVLDTYLNVAVLGGLPIAATLLGTPEFASVLGIAPAEYDELVAPIVERVLIADARINAARDAQWVTHATETLCRELAGAGGHAASRVARVRKLMAEVGRRVADIAADGAWSPGVAAAHLELELVPVLDTIRQRLYNRDPKRGFFYTPGNVQRIAAGKYRRSRDVQFRTVCTVMDADEVEPSGPSDSRSGSASDAAATEGEPPMTDDSAQAVAPETTESDRKSCQCCSAPRALVYALGRLGYDFVSNSRRDSLQQKLPADASLENPAQLLDYLEKNPWDAQAVQWLLLIENTPVYVVEPQGAYGREGFELLRQFMREQLTDEVERVSIPGVITGVATLRAGYALPVVSPEIRGMFSWSTKALVDSVLVGKRAKGRPSAGERDAHEKTRSGVHNFLDRVYYGLRNLGQAPQDRALNFAATSAFRLETVYAASVKEELELDDISVERNPIARPGADCWDVQLSFFAPRSQPQTNRKIYRLTIDVSDVVPVNVSEVRSWFVR